MKLTLIIATTVLALALPVSSAGQYSQYKLADLGTSGVSNRFSCGVLPEAQLARAKNFTFTTMDVPDAKGTWTWAINDAGAIVGGFYVGGPLAGNVHGFLFRDGIYTQLDFPGAAFTNSANGINSAGEIVGYWFDFSDTQHGFLLSGGTYTRIDFPGSAWSEARGINSAGQIVGVYGDAVGTSHGFLLSAGRFSSIDFPGAVGGSVAKAINDAGDIVGRYDNADGSTHGFLLSKGRFTSIDFPGASLTIAGSINSGGDILGRYTSAIQHGFLRRKGGRFSSIDFPRANYTDATGINARGDVVGTYFDTATSLYPHGYLLTAGDPDCRE